MDYCSTSWPYPLLFYSSVLGNHMFEELGFSLKNLESELFHLDDCNLFFFFPLNWNFFKTLFAHCIFFIGSASFRSFSIVLHGNSAEVCLCLEQNPLNNQSLTFFMQRLTLKCCPCRLTCEVGKDKWLCLFMVSLHPISAVIKELVFFTFFRKKNNWR